MFAKVCQEEFNYNATLDTSAEGRYRLSGAMEIGYVRETPYEVGVLVKTLNSLNTLFRKVDIVGSVTNSYGNTWYKTKDGYYIYHEHLTFDSAFPEGAKTTATISASGGLAMHSTPDYNSSSTIATIPNGASVSVLAEKTSSTGILKVQYGNSTGFASGNYINLKDSNRSTNLKINTSAITLEKGKTPTGSFVISSSQNITYVNAKLDGANVCYLNPGKKSADLSGTSVFTSSKWKNLSAGSHTLKLTVMDAGGSVINRNINVTVSSSAVNPPTFSVVDTNNGKQVTINQVSGATLTYTYYNGTYTSSNRSVTFTMEQSGKIEAYSTKSGVKSPTASYDVSVVKLYNPEISSELTAEGAKVTITGAPDANTYYSINNGAYQSYYGTFLMTASGTVKAFSTRSGYMTSDTVSQSITVSAPAVPVVTRFNTEATVPAESTVSVQWDNDGLAASYTARLYKGEVLLEEKTVGGRSTAFSVGDAGVYSVTVTASNAIGSSGESSAVTFTAKAPSTVLFLDWDGTLISAQSVRYGSDAVRPTAPTRRGYTFDGWSQGYTNVRSDLTITAEYAINSYNVKFYAENGTTLLNSQYVNFGSPADTTPAANALTLNPGYVLAGWRVERADAESALDLNSVDSDMTVVAVTRWENMDLPVIATVNSASWSSLGTGYDVGITLNVADEEVLSAAARIVKIIASVKTSENKLLGVEIHTVNLNSSTLNGTYSMFVQCDSSALADRIEVSVLGGETSNRTGTVLARTSSMVPAYGDNGIYWSEWSETEPVGIDPSQVESKIQYRYRDNEKQTTSSTTSSMEGWTYYQTTTGYTDWVDKGWTRTQPSTSTTLKITDTKTVTDSAAYTQYKYYHYWGKNSSGTLYNSYGNGVWKNYESTTSTSAFPTYNVYDGHQSYKKSVSGMHGSVWWLDSKTTVPAVTHTEWRYSTRSSYSVYWFYKWNYGTWSDWGDTAVTATESRDVETRTVYRYITAVATEDTSGLSRTLEGSLGSDLGDLSGKTATVMVYKERNTDPTQEQMEFIGQLILGQNNQYSLSYKTREEPSEQTGDFLMVMALEGTSNLLSLGTIPAPRPEYTVSFLGMDGSVIDTQTVLKGDDAVLPQAPEVEGYTFLKWSGTPTNIQRSQSYLAEYTPVTYAVAYVDWLTETIDLTTAHYGDTLEPPEITTVVPGYTFLGWDAVMAGDSTVNGNKVVEAVYEADTFTVTFLADDDSIVSLQTVEYGKSAVLPEGPSEADRIFLGWATDVMWWNVTEDMVVSPIYAFTETAIMPQSSLGTEEMDAGGLLELSTEEADAEIYYTLDGTDPDIYSTLYTEAIDLQLAGTEIIKAVSVVPGKNDSDVFTFRFYESEFEYYEDEQELEEIDTVQLTAAPEQEFTLTVSALQDLGLSQFMLALSCDREKIYPIWDADSGYHAEAGTAAAEGLLGVSEEDYGWSIFWSGDTVTDGAGDLVSIHFKAAAELSDSSCPITVSCVPLFTLDASGQEASAAAAAMTVTATAGEGQPQIVITRQPVNYVGAEGSTATFTVEAQGDGLTYQWWIRNPGEAGFTKSTRRTATYSTTLKAANSGRELYCVITDSHGNSVTTNTVTMSIAAALTITQQPVDYVGAEGSTATFTVAAQGEGTLTYQWWIRNPGENEFTPSTRRTATYTTTLKAASNGRELYCVVTDASGNSVTSDVVTMTIEGTVTIARQPVNYVGAAGSTASVTVVAVGEGLTYQWWIRNPGETEFSLSTRRTATYTTTLKAASSGRELYCVVTDAEGNFATTDVVTMTIG